MKKEKKRKRIKYSRDKFISLKFTKILFLWSILLIRCLIFHDAWRIGEARYHMIKNNSGIASYRK